MARKLPHYLRTHRKRLGFSQDEIAWLLGCRSGTKVSRYERYVRTPTLATALAYEVIFGVPASQLFAGLFEGVRDVTLRRAALLARRLEQVEEPRPDARKLTHLATIQETHGSPHEEA